MVCARLREGDKAPDLVGRLLKDLRDENRRLSAELDALRRQKVWYARKLEAGSALAGRLRQTRVYRHLRRVGLWGWAADLIDDIDLNGHPMRARVRTPGTLKRVAIDLAGMRTDGQRGGSAVFVVSLLELLQRSWPDVHFAVAAEDAVAEKVPRGDNISFGPSVESTARNADLLFCPLGSVPMQVSHNLPIVTVVYDLQHRVFADFFSPEELDARERDLRRACSVSDRVVCISDFVRSTLLDTGLAEPAAVASIPVRFEPIQDLIPRDAALPLGLKPNEYFLYPANFWEHKNHELLLTAIGVFFGNHPQSSVKFVCTGYASDRMAELERAVQGMGLGERVLLPGYLDREAFLDVLAGCRALVFPSLYEGFGMPVAEAILMGKPVIASRIPAIQEIAADAALYFDPKNPHEISARLAEFESNPNLSAELLERARPLRESLEDVDGAAMSYRKLFEEAAGGAALAQ